MRAVPTKKSILVNDPVSVTDIATRLGVRATAVSNWRQRHSDFPKPVFMVANSQIAVWEWAPVALWHGIHTKAHKSASASRSTSLVRGADIARMFGVSPQAVSNWLNRHEDFPRPVGTVPGPGRAGGASVWERSDVERWYRLRRGNAA